MRESNVDDQLVQQKNKLIKLIDDGKVREANYLLDFVSPLWASLDYGYKAFELRERITNNLLN